MTPERQQYLEDEFFAWQSGDDHYPNDWSEFLSRRADTEEERAFLASLDLEHNCPEDR